MKRKLIAASTALLLLGTLVTPCLAVNAKVIYRDPATAIVISPGRKDILPDISGQFSFDQISSRMKRANLTILSLQSTLDAQMAFDRQKAYSSLNGSIAQLEITLYYLKLAAGPTPTLEQTLTMAQLESTIASLETQLEALKEDTYKENIALFTMQIGDAINQVIYNTELLYINIISVEHSLADLHRGLDTLERTLAEMELRYELGQISYLTLEQMRETYRATQSQATALESNISTMKASLENLLGTKVSGSIALSSLPEISGTQKQIASLSYASGLATSKKNSYTIHQLEKNLADAEDAWKDVKKDYRPTTYQYKQGEQTYEAAVYTHQNGVKNYETAFLSVYNAIATAQTSLDSLRIGYDFQKTLYAAEERKYELGQISAATLESAKDQLNTAESAVTSAEITLFSAYNNYYWAYYYGLL